MCRYQAKYERINMLLPKMSIYHEFYGLTVILAETTPNETMAFR